MFALRRQEREVAIKVLHKEIQAINEQLATMSRQYSGAELKQ